MTCLAIETTALLVTAIVSMFVGMIVAIFFSAKAHAIWVINEKEAK